MLRHFVFLGKLKTVRAAALVAPLLIGVFPGSPARADAVEPVAISANKLGKYYPPPVDGPGLRLPESPTRLYLDAGLAVSNDLSALPYVAGKGRNLRFAAGGVWRWRRFAFEGELPFVNVTTIDVTAVPGGQPTPEDANQTSIGLGDLRLGAIWSTPLVGAESLVGGFGLRGRLATHTTRFAFQLIDMTYADFVIPYYFHIEPTLILGGALGRLTFVVNQGVKVLVGPDGHLRDETLTVPTIYFWDAQYALALAPWHFLGTSGPSLGASLALATDIQLNHVPGVDFAKVNNIRAAWLAPGVQVHVGGFRFDAIARIGLTRGQELFGVLEYVGTHSLTLRMTRHFY
jgi:hypothetical protein